MKKQTIFLLAIILLSCISIVFAEEKAINLPSCGKISIKLSDGSEWSGSLIPEKIKQGEIIIRIRMDSGNEENSWIAVCDEESGRQKSDFEKAICRSLSIVK